MATIRLPNSWVPRPYQRRLWSYLEGGGRRAVEVAHRRWGKDDVALNWSAVAMHQRVGTYWHMLPEAAQARKAIWEAVNPHTGRRRIDEAFPRALREVTRENEMFIRMKVGSTWQVLGSDNFNSLVGSPPVGLVSSEHALANPAAWSYLRPILLENDGWALFISTPLGNNHFKTLLDSAREGAGWFAEVSPVTETHAIAADLLEQERIEYIRENGQDQGLALFRQEWECSFDAAIVGAYYVGELDQAEREGRIREVPYDPALPVSTWWDLGLDDATSVWFTQDVGAKIHVIDYGEWTQTPLVEVARQVMNRPYAFSEHGLPHDARARELTTGRSREEVMRAILGRVTIIPLQAVADGINAVRTIFPRCWFDREKTAQGREGLRNYRKRYDEKRRTFDPHPLHDWASHPADAFRQKAVSYREKIEPRTESAARSPRGRRRGGGGWGA